MFRRLKTTDAIQGPPSDNFRFAPKGQRALATSNPERETSPLVGDVSSDPRG
jgi:hypothetical protein